jgi:hypothetical protein
MHEIAKGNRGLERQDGPSISAQVPYRSYVIAATIILAILWSVYDLLPLMRISGEKFLIKELARRGNDRITIRRELNDSRFVLVYTEPLRDQYLLPRRPSRLASLAAVFARQTGSPNCYEWILRHFSDTVLISYVDDEVTAIDFRD